MSEGASRHGRDRRDGRGSSRSGGHSRSSGSRRSGGPGGQRQARQHVKQYRQKILDELAKKEAEFGQRSVDEFVCSIDYSNQLPDVPFDPKFLPYPFDASRLFRYDHARGSSLEQAHKFRLHATPSLATIPVIDPREYNAPSAEAAGPLHPVDAELVSDKWKVPAADRRKKRDRIAEKSKVSWMMAGEVLLNDFSQNAVQHNNEDAALTKQVEAELAALDERMRSVPKRDRIEQSFAAVADDKEIVNPSNPDFEPKRVFTLLPDDDRWGPDYITVSFDTDPNDIKERRLDGRDAADPAPDVDQPLAKRARLSRGLIRSIKGRTTKSGGLVGHFLLPEPSAAAAAEASAGSGDATEFRMVREYEMETHAAGAKATHTVVLRLDAENATAHYTDTVARVDMRRHRTKRRAAGAAITADDEPPAVEDVIVQRRQPTALESVKQRRSRVFVSSTSPESDMLALEADEAAALEAEGEEEDGGEDLEEAAAAAGGAGTGADATASQRANGGAGAGAGRGGDDEAQLSDDD